jgi:predicted ABC-type ATPase
MPQLYIIAGSNGAGKSSVGANYLPVDVRGRFPIFDGDKLFMQKQKELWLSGVTAIKEAKNLAITFVRDTFDNLVNEALIQNTSFIYEGHFTNEATWDIPKKFKSKNYSFNMIFFGVATPDISELRVIERAKEGGHYVSRRTIEDNFYGNLEKLNKYFELIDNLTIVDTSEANHVIIANFLKGTIGNSIPCAEIPAWFKVYLPSLFQRISDDQANNKSYH